MIYLGTLCILYIECRGIFDREVNPWAPEIFRTRSCATFPGPPLGRGGPSGRSWRDIWRTTPRRCGPRDAPRRRPGSGPPVLWGAGGGGTGAQRAVVPVLAVAGAGVPYPGVPFAGGGGVRGTARQGGSGRVFKRTRPIWPGSIPTGTRPGPPPTCWERQSLPPSGETRGRTGRGGLSRWRRAGRGGRPAGGVGGRRPIRAWPGPG